MALDFDAKVIKFNGFGADAYKGTGTSGPDDPNFTKRILCEGDSWFSIGAIPSGNLLLPLQFDQSTLLVNLAQPGDTIRKMASISKNPVLAQLIAAPNFDTAWDAIFISGGGNDLIDDANQIICKPSAGAGKHMLDYINHIDLENLKQKVKKGFTDIANLRNGSEKNATTRIITHIYDYPTPRDAKATFLGFKVKGPWLYPAFKQHDIPVEFWISITDYLFEQLGACIISLVSQIDNFHVITSTRETLVRARLHTEGQDGDWLNEIHPTTEGYTKLGAKISVEMQHLLSAP
jgi:hypothetical protein|nr:hypothetical protein [uncultured Albidiferax sp.]